MRECGEDKTEEETERVNPKDEGKDHRKQDGALVDVVHGAHQVGHSQTRGRRKNGRKRKGKKRG